MIVRYLWSIWTWFVSALLFLLWVPMMAVVRLFDRDPLVIRTGRFLRVLGKLLIGVHFPTLYLSGLENISQGQNYMVVVNHQSFIDIPLVAYLPLDSKCMARADLFRIPWVGWTLLMSKQIAIDRKDPRNAARAMLQCVRVLKGGCSILIYPEGTRSPDGELLPFSEGPFQLALRQKVPVLPVVIDGTGNNLGKNAALFERRHPMFMTVLPAIPIAPWDGRQASELRDMVWEKMAAELARLRAANPDAEPA